LRGVSARSRAHPLFPQVLASLLSAGAVPPLPKFASAAVARHVKARFRVLTLPV
jgi:hypothetical protein